MKSLATTRIGRAASAAVLAMAAGMVHASGSTMPARWQLNMGRGVTESAHNAYHAHMIALWVCVVIGVIVFGAMAYAMFKFRKSKGAVAAQWSHNTKAEVIWTVIPILILVVMAWPATQILIKQADTSNPVLTVKVTGYQWKWRYEYVDYEGKPTGVNFVSKLDADSDKTRQLKSGLDPHAVKVGEESTYLLNVDKPLVLPTGVKVRFVITADDVIHAWWVPALGWKTDAIPDIINDAWTLIEQPGTYRGQCAELCGQDHGFMPIVVEAMPKALFDQWLATQQQPAAPNATPAAPAVAAAPQG
ncbi:cytochrome c oxidase subunit 2 [Tahibacter aquaticus]|uniref:Cytochrome c oxidase subunit 2 n=1 Tax=Tahibacter aquaticus TaxID=520092 RepID=A0A4R6YT47_9GAMM|nr:cytochrome c oxidase subunit 2 [Tahibacter aquaticus]